MRRTSTGIDGIVVGLRTTKSPSRRWHRCARACLMNIIKGGLHADNPSKHQDVAVNAPIGIRCAEADYISP